MAHLGKSDSHEGGFMLHGVAKYLLDIGRLASGLLAAVAVVVSVAAVAWTLPSVVGDYFYYRGLSEKINDPKLRASDPIFPKNGIFQYMDGRPQRDEAV